ncbi:MAG: hypothetical protein P8I61_00185 [Opitutae bacterium]|jgi:hypothetical protein|nr:hypothetical protein [Opitutae bacterium]
MTNSSNSSSTKLPPASKFIPNLEQLHRAIADLPDAETFEEDTFTTTILLQTVAKQITFTKKKIQRGSHLVGRWIYEGKILIRNQDQDRVS